MKIISSEKDRGMYTNHITKFIIHKYVRYEKIPECIAARSVHRHMRKKKEKVNRLYLNNQHKYSFIVVSKHRHYISVGIDHEDNRRRYDKSMCNNQPPEKHAKLSRNLYKRKK